MSAGPAVELVAYDSRGVPLFKFGKCWRCPRRRAIATLTPWGLCSEHDAAEWAAVFVEFPELEAELAFELDAWEQHRGACVHCSRLNCQGFVWRTLQRTCPDLSVF